MNIAIDIDDTIAETNKEIDIYAKKYTENILKREFKLGKLEVLEPMWAKHLYNWTIDEDKKFWDLYYEEIMSNVKPKNNVAEILNKLINMHNIIIITARWDRKNGIISEITKKWLKKYNIPYNKLYIGYEDKRKIVKENNIDLFIDDSIKTCKEISEMNIRTFIMNSRINQNMQIDNIERVFTWKEIATKIKEV